jgi:hypothetical protein
MYFYLITNEGQMTAYIIDTVLNKVVRKVDVNFDMSDTYAHEWGVRYILASNQDSAYEYWETTECGSGKFYEGLGVSEDKKHEMFKDWLTN